MKKSSTTSKNLALVLLLLMICLFIGSLFAQRYSPAWAWVKAFAEAGTVGALADWFAVVALFRYPMGIPFPHTNIIENKRLTIAEGLSTFVVENFLTEEIIRQETAQLNLIDRLYHWAQSEKEVHKISQLISKNLPRIVGQIDHELADIFLYKNIEKAVLHWDVRQFITDLLAFQKKQNRHHLLAQQVIKLVSENRQMIFNQLYEELGKTTSFLEIIVLEASKNRARDKFYKFLDDIDKDYHSMLGDWTDRQTDTLLKKLGNDPQWQSQIDTYRKELINSEQFHQMSRKLWSENKDKLIAILVQKEGQIADYLDTIIKNTITETYQDQELKENLNQKVQESISDWVIGQRTKISGIIETTVREWKDLSPRLEQEVGADLQYIRINGTLIGGLIGLLLFAIEQLIG